MRLGYFSNPSDKAPGDCFHQFSSSSSRPLDFNNPPLRKNWVTSDEISARFQFFGMPLFLLCDQYCCKQVIHTTCTGRRFRIELRKWNLSELFCMMFERWLSNFTKTSQKLHSEQLHFRSSILSSHPVVYPCQGQPQKPSSRSANCACTMHNGVSEVDSSRFFTRQPAPEVSVIEGLRSVVSQ